MRSAFNRSLRYVVFLSACAIMTGCSTTSKPPVLIPPQPVVSQKGIIHTVLKGETLWRISKTYSVAVDEIIRANNIPNAASIEVGQLLVIPGAAAVLPVSQVAVSTENNNDYLWPVKGRVVSYFQSRKGAHVNPGIDIQGMEGEPVKASRAGTVVFADRLAGYGPTIILDHDDGFFTVYAKSDRLLVDLGAKVFRGEKIAQLEADDRQDVIHFEVRKGDISKNPLHYLPQEM